MRISVIIPAAGMGKRMGAQVNKQLLQIEGQTITALTIRQFLAQKNIAEVILVVNPDDRSAMSSVIESLGKIETPVKMVDGGKERVDSVMSGIGAVDATCTHVFVHDGARPFVDKELLNRLMRSLEEHDAVVPVVASKDTLKWMTSQHIDRTIDRNHVYRVQTPQCFTLEVANRLKEHAASSGNTFTDEASICEDLGIRVYGAVGSEWNIKLTTPEDMVLGRAIYTHLKGENKCE
ncbi:MULTISPECIES: 2-C-methyl-D-erythritol 4-phosphate cytidylyltransferase [unclassified Fusibacter]|uniref:2-C-methyl-D-erythritol 4-phosphate cytidylyltransferase n=1 Tax=unclassified Fusibacter TaxID=2624464 RepID=UPI001013BFA3|nr:MULTISPECIES: 2-C-methyl-D-erythritol 4-phosphate cytidylyltransferase [unclassified Fusibacter]MCK8061351.1 2-C-methyl-D-erythritol 4-phosphate cytidylyltransferase [Fusibacter sp. A2]NPE23606.1 2-C-methyl-D-erythritol 4-phosphate cytidylyltransferase [Fusibacter sp. A1]RXV59014.1 2-C-methyl-D-erythritol 4-phosphate cytidylyltransferase [Fusibacter sp. A1]